MKEERHKNQTYTSPYAVARTNDWYEYGSGEEYAGHYISQPVDLGHRDVEISGSWRGRDRHQKQKPRS